MKFSIPVFTTIIITFVFSYCSTNSKKMSGSFVCKQHYNNEMVDKLSLDLHSDGTIELVSESMKSNGTYSTTKDSIFINTDFFDMSLKVKGDSLIGWNVLYVKRP